MSASISSITALRTHAGQGGATCISEFELLFSFASLSKPINQKQNEEEEKRAAADDSAEEDFFVHNPHFFLLPFRRIVTLIGSKIHC